MDRELFEELNSAKERYRTNLTRVNREKGMYLVEMCNLRDNTWHNVTYYVLSVTVNHNDDGMSTATVRLKNRHFELTGRGILTENFGVRIYLGYPDTGLIFQGEFVADTPTPEFPSDGFPTITLNCKDKLLEAADKNDIQEYSEGTNDDVIKSISEDHGWEYEDSRGYYDTKGNYEREQGKYEFDEGYEDNFGEKSKANTETRHPRRVRSGISEYQFMKELAVESGCVLYTESRYNKFTGEVNTRLHFHTPKQKDPKATLWYRCPYNPLLNNVVSFSPSEVTFDRAAGISTGDINERTGEEIFQVSEGNRTPLDDEMINDDFDYPKNWYAYRQYDKHDKSYPYEGGEEDTGFGERRGGGSSSAPGGDRTDTGKLPDEEYYKRRPIYETISALEKGRIPNRLRRKYKHIPHLLNVKSNSHGFKVVENIDAAGHFLLEAKIDLLYGFPELRQSDLVRMMGAKFYDGLWYVKTVSHTIDESKHLSTVIDARSNSTFGVRSDGEYDNYDYSFREESDYSEDDFSENQGTPYRKEYYQEKYEKEFFRGDRGE